MILVYAFNPYGTSSWDPRARIFGFTTYRIASGSMEPTLAKSDLILVGTSAYLAKGPKTGDVIVFRYPKDRSVPFVFRVVGEAGDKVKIVEGKTYVNGVALGEPYIRLPNQRPYSQTMPEFRVSDREVFVLGDNRDNANDSRFWGAVPQEDVIGKVLYIWYSPDSSRIGSIP